MLNDKLNELVRSKVSQLHEGDFWHPDPAQDRKLGGPGANQRAREDRAAASKPKEDPRKLRPGESYMDFAKRHGYKSRTESHVPGQPAERLGAVTAIPQKERDAARERLLAKTKAIRDKKKIEEKIDVGADAAATISDFVHSKDSRFAGDSKKQRIKRALGAYYAARNEEFEIDESIKNPERRAKLRSIMDKEVRKGDKTKGENPRKQYHTEKGKQAWKLFAGSDATGSEGNPVRSRGGTNAPAGERVGKGPHRAGNAAYWASNAGPNRDRGSGNAASRRAAALKKEEFEIEEGMDMKAFKANRKKLQRKEASDDAKKRGHVGKEWYNSGRTYSPGEAKSNRSKLDDEERSTRHRSAVDPEGEDSNYSAVRTKNAKKLRKQKAMGEITKESRSFSQFMIAELNRYEKETGKDLKTGKPVTKGGTMGGDDTQSKVMRHMHKVMGAGRMGAGGAIQPRGQKKVPGKKPPTAGQYGGPASPAQKVAKRRAAAKASQDFMNDTRGT